MDLFKPYSSDSTCLSAATGENCCKCKDRTSIRPRQGSLSLQLPLKILFNPFHPTRPDEPQGRRPARLACLAMENGPVVAGLRQPMPIGAPSPTRCRGGVPTWS